MKYLRHSSSLLCRRERGISFASEVPPHDCLVEFVRIEYPILGCYSRDLGHDLGDGFRGPVEWMRVLIPLKNELSNLGLGVLFRSKISDSQAFALNCIEQC